MFESNLPKMDVWGDHSHRKEWVLESSLPTRRFLLTVRCH